ncbi:hypothetical protein GCM10009790_35540 [Georgenia ruanii]|uniref:type II secretion system F family protein n=1 Tax=Georgenia ruanii TaxID=348442 RepID=UPI0031CE1D0F
MTPLLVVLALLAALPWALPARVRRAASVRRPATRAAPRAVDVTVLLDLTDAALAAGASIPRALQAVGRAVDPPGAAGAARGRAGRGTAAGPHPVGPALRQAGAALVLGAPWAEAWQAAPGWLAPLADALEPAWVDGAAPSPLLRRAAEAVRADRQRQAQEAAARLGVRLVLPLGLCFLPAFVLLGIVPVVVAAGGGFLGG